MKQITIITPADRPGIIADIAEKLAARQVNILQMDASDDHAHGVIFLEAEPYDEALRALADSGYHAISEEVLAIRIKDEPGALARVAARFREPQINIRAMRIVRRDGGWATVILSTSDNAQARQLLSDCLVSSDSAANQ
jgi:hypothetical protein